MRKAEAQNPAVASGARGRQTAGTTTLRQLANTNNPQQPPAVNAPVHEATDIESKAGSAAPELQEDEAISEAQSEVKPSIKSSRVALATPPSTQPSSLATKPPKPPETVTEANESLSELPSSKPGKINLDKFRQSQDFVEHGGGKKLLTVVPVRKPSKESWFRAHPNMDFRVKVKVIELKDGQRETYLVDPDLWTELEGESTFVSKLLVPILTRQQALIIWPIRLPGPDGRIDDWNVSSLEAAKIAVEKWVRLSPNMALGANDIMIGPDPQGEPVWPEYSFQEIIDIAFRDKYICSLDHPIIRQLRPQ